MSKKEEKKQPIGSIVYIVHVIFEGTQYSFVANMQTFGTNDSAEKHLCELEYMFLPISQNHFKKLEDCKYFVKVLEYYPGTLNINHSDQVFLNEQKRHFINEYKDKYYLNNIMLNPDECTYNMFMQFNRDKKKEIKEWIRHQASLYDLCMLADWLKGKNVDLINSYPRYFWFDDDYVKVITNDGIYTNDYNVLMTLLALKDWLVDQNFLDSLSDFWYYLQHPSDDVQNQLKTWKLGKYYKTSKRYKNIADYANKYMYWFCSSNNYENGYKLKAKMSSKMLQ